MPNLEYSIAEHHKQMQLWWTLPEYRNARKSFVRRNPKCCRCGRKTTTPGHSHADYISYEAYLSAVVEDRADPLCNACNLMEKKDMKPCPECVKRYHETKGKTGIKYIRSSSEKCIVCENWGKEA